MATVLGINAAFHDPSAALVVDGRTVAAAEEERFSRRKHGKRPVPFSAWELPEQAIRWCLSVGGVQPDGLDAVGYSFRPEPASVPGGDVTAREWEGLRTLYVMRAPSFLRTVLGTDRPVPVTFIPHHEAHAASAYHGAGYDDCAVLVVDGRGEETSSLAGRVRDGSLEPLAATRLPHSLGLMYEELTDHLGFLRSSDEYKVMALASYAQPAHIEAFRKLVRFDGAGGFITERAPWDEFHPRVGSGEIDLDAAELAASLQCRLEEVLVEAATWLHEETGEPRLALAGGVALNCVANSRMFRESPFGEIWVQPAAGDAGTALGAAWLLARELGDKIEPMHSAALGPSWTADQIEETLRGAEVPYQQPDDLPAAVGELLAGDSVVGWFQGAAEFGPRALGQRSLLAHPGKAHNTERLNRIKGREMFRPIAPMVMSERADEIFSGGPLPSPFMLFTHGIAEDWWSALPSVTHVDGTSRIQTVDANDLPEMHRCLESFEASTGLPVLINTSFNTAGRPMVHRPLDALEAMGSTPIDALAIGPFVVRRRHIVGP